ncbi:aromatic ring-hydroxylating oxygenase subunit alpha [Usitatibacter palustris]|uniref:Carnitine monooxygenase oxygenase subunit n=1 Tax=Usitatibacter palustris TaxID=2732487 RepID=A0A6M4HB29_9PROT|nr:SRPBCC family protein [Usitatibacter palustris]QJR16048.1 Carnitine monooxygenase oxygenase subunit [Usitatibacter palustris]
MTSLYRVDPDITQASTIEASFYSDAAAFALARDRIFARSWQWLGDLADVVDSGSLSPRDVLPGCLDEPLLLARDAAGELRCLSNVCTHRGNILVKAPCHAKEIRCGYHSRRFDLAGKMTFMPEFKEARDFPSATDDLPRVPFATWAGHAFASIAPAAPLTDFLSDVRSRIDEASVAGYHYDPSRSRDYEIDAHWALYVENYLEGFHIPFVHAGLNEVVDYGNYSSELFRYSNLQLALTKAGDVAAHYFWVFPNLMLNFYPWGLSLNLVEPLGMNRTRVKFRSYVGDASKLDTGAGSSLDRVELEDEAIVHAVSRGVRSRFYKRGRYSPTRERGVHHFHRLLCEFLE